MTISDLKINMDRQRVMTILTLLTQRRLHLIGTPAINELNKTRGDKWVFKTRLTRLLERKKSEQNRITWMDK